MNPRITLAIETAIKGGSIAILRDYTEIASLSGNQDLSRAEDLIPNIRALLSTAEVEIDQIDVIGVSVGPGSYTGIRIGIATALGLKAASDSKVVGLSVLKAIAANYSNGGGIVAAVPIGREDVAWQEFEGDPDTSSIGEPLIHSAEHFSAWLSENPDKVIALYPTLYDSIVGDEQVRSANSKLIRTSSNLAFYVGKAVAGGLGTSDLTPLYLLNPARSRGLF